MVGLLLRIVVNAVALGIAAALINGITVGGASDEDRAVTLLLVAVIFGLVNAVIRPVVRLIALPLYVLTLGLITFVINALMLMLTSWLSRQGTLEFGVESFGAALLGALVVTVASWVAQPGRPGAPVSLTRFTSGRLAAMVDGRDVIASLIERPERAGLVMDFDGVLSPIVSDPGQSRLPAGTAELLADLAGALALVALVSGRPVAFLAERATVPGVALLGAYGVETQRDGRRHVLPEVERFRDTVAQASAELHRRFDGSPGTEGIRVEDKGLAVAVHWRQAADEPAARRLVRTGRRGADRQHRVAPRARQARGGAASPRPRGQGHGRTSADRGCQARADRVRR